jgi:hypothetical protein
LSNSDPDGAAAIKHIRRVGRLRLFAKMMGFANGSTQPTRRRRFVSAR